MQKEAASSAFFACLAAFQFSAAAQISLWARSCGENRGGNLNRRGIPSNFDEEAFCPQYP
jgi:hypothetical protein